MSSFTPFYSKLTLKKANKSSDSGNQTGDTLEVYEDVSNTKKETHPKFSIRFQYIERYVPNSSPIQMKEPSKRWFVHYEFLQHTYFNHEGGTTSYFVNLWDNHGQTYQISHSPRYSRDDPTLQILEDSTKFPEPLPDIMIDFIKGIPFSHTLRDQALFNFQTKLNHLYIPRETVRKEMRELEELRAEVKELREETQTQQQEVVALRVGLRELEATHERAMNELAEQKTLVRVLTGSLGRIVDRPIQEVNNKNRILPTESVPTNPTQPTNPFDTI